jgi:uroporphyrinogen decarboxylase
LGHGREPSGAAHRTRGAGHGKGLPPIPGGYGTEDGPPDEQLVESQAAFHTRFLDAADRLDFFSIGDDFAHDRGLIMSPECWRRLLRPAIARFSGIAKSRGLRTWFHCCGMVREIPPDLIELGLDVLEPCQVHLPGMRPEDLKREFGRHITFFGAINTQSTLPYGSPEDVRGEVRERVAVLDEGGGYIVSSDHTVLADVPVASVLAMYEAAGSHVR